VDVGTGNTLAGLHEIQGVRRRNSPNDKFYSPYVDSL
jgi:hypothetical protein